MIIKFLDFNKNNKIAIINTIPWFYQQTLSYISSHSRLIVIFLILEIRNYVLSITGLGSNFLKNRIKK